jgi:hypothetical protein
MLTTATCSANAQLSASSDDGRVNSLLGISGADVSAYETATISFGTLYDLSTEPPTASGQLEVLGLIAADCSSEQEESEPGVATPGCAGMDSSVVDSATW